MLAELLSQLQERQGNLEAPNSGLAAALELSWDTLDEAIQQIAMVLSLFAPAPVPQEMLEQVTDAVWDEATNRENISTACSILIQKHWLQLTDRNTYRLHALIRNYLQTKLNRFSDSDCLKQTFCQAMVVFAEQLSDPPSIEECTAFAPAIPHIAEVATTWQAWLPDENIVSPFFCLGRFCTAQGAFDQAAHWYEQCLSEARNRLDNNHLATASSLTHLADLYYIQYRYQEAEPLYQEALRILQQVLGEEHLAVAISLTNLANLYKAQGHYSESEPLYQRSLSIQEQRLGTEHPSIAQSLNNLAVLYDNQGRYSEAEPLYQQALAMYQQLLGSEHPDVAQNLNNLAVLYHNQGRYSEAELLYQQALAMRQWLLGSKHPDVAQSLNNLAGIYYRQGYYSGAEPLYQQALEIVEQQLGSEHPTTVTIKENLEGLRSQSNKARSSEETDTKILMNWEGDRRIQR